MGFIKKVIAFLGDVLNTTSRIESACNDFGEELIVSDFLMSSLKEDARNKIKSLGKIKFRGRETKLAVSSVYR